LAAARWKGGLTRVQTLPPDYSAADPLIDDRQGLMLDPIDTEVLLAGQGDDQGWWPEFHCLPASSPLWNRPCPRPLLSCDTRQNRSG
jgi:hypothetical protein